MNFGVRAHDFGKLPIEELSAKISQKGFKSIQLALAKALAGIEVGNGTLSPGMAKYIRNELAQNSIDISVLGCYVNIGHPDDNERALLLSRFKEHIRYAKDFGCSIVGTETGSINADYSFNPKNHGEKAFQRALDSISILVNEAEKFGVFVCIEGVSSHIINTPKRIKRVLDSINSNNLQVIFDPVNLLNPENYLSQREIIDEAFSLFGDRIIVIHAKDFIVENGKMKNVPIGDGLLDYEYLFSILKRRKPYISILLEDQRVENMDNSLLYLEDAYKKSF